MADFNQINQFGSAKPARSGEGMSCSECEAMVTDAIDGALSERDRAAFDLHVSTCAECSRMLSDARRGAALLDTLKTPRPEPSSLLLERILSRTSGATAASGRVASEATTGMTGIVVPEMQFSGVASVPIGAIDLVPVGAALAPGNMLQFRSRAAGKFNAGSMVRTMMQPRLAMTAAMAFFSIALTMNLTGVHLSELKASDLKPSSLRRSFYQADASLVRYYDNLRVVYELESRVRDLKQSGNSDDAQGAKSSAKDGTKDGSSDGTPEDKQQQKKAPKSGSGTSERRNPLPLEFKLAVEHFGFLPDHGQTLSAIAFGDSPTLTNKSIEAPQEGGLV